MNTKLLNYKMNIDEYINRYNILFRSIEILLRNHYIKLYKNSEKSYGKNIALKSTIYNDLLINYINLNNKDELFKIRSNDKKHFYICIGNLPMYDKNVKYYGNYNLVMHYSATNKLNKFKLLNFKQYLKIEDYINEYELVDQNILNNLIKDYENIKV